MGSQPSITAGVAALLSCIRADKCFALQPPGAMQTFQKQMQYSPICTTALNEQQKRKEKKAVRESGILSQLII